MSVLFCSVGRSGGRIASTSPGGRAAVAGSSTSLSSTISQHIPTDYGLQKPPSPKPSGTAPPAVIRKLSNWATVQDLTNKNKPPLSVRTSNVSYQNPPRSGALSPAKSTLGLTHMAENVPPYSQYVNYTNIPTPSIGYAMSTPDISAGQMSASLAPKSPSWYPQKFPKPLFDFSISGRESQETVGANAQYANPSYSEFAARLNAVKKNERRSLPTNMMPRYNDYQNLKELHMEDNSKPFQGKPDLHGVNDALDDEILNGPMHPVNDPRPLYSPPAPPVRDISSLKYINMNQAHEKYPSWPVSSPNTDMSVPDSINSRPGTWLDSVKSENKKTGQGQPFQQQLHVLKERNSPTSDNRNDEKPARNASDPGFKSPSPLKQFIKLKVPTSRERDQAMTEKKSNHFEEIIKSKPGYPLPVRDSDGHSYGDEKYSIPSPPERDMPGVDEKSLGEKITSLVAPAYMDHYQDELRVSTDQKDSATSPIQSPAQYTARNNGPLKAFPIPQKKVDMATSPLQSPNGSKFILGGFPNYNQSNAYHQSKNCNYIVKQVVTPYYNTGTQTEEVLKNSKSPTATRPKHLLPEAQPIQTSGEYQKVRDISIQARMSSHGSDSEHDAISPKTDVNVSVADSRPSANQSADSIGSISQSAESKVSMIQSVSTDYTAPMMRKLSEEYFNGRLHGGHVDKRHSTSSSFDYGTRSPAFGVMKEAESYNSVIIHPGESSKPFGKDYENVSNVFDQDSLSTEPEQNYFVYPKAGKGRYSLDPAMLRNSNLPHRNSYDSRYSSEQALTNTYSNLTETSNSVSMLDIKSDQSRVPQYSSSDVSPVSQPRSSDDTRTSKSTSFTSENSPIAAPKYDPNDSVFESKMSPTSVSNSSESQNMPMMSRKISMKKAYGTYDDFDKLLGIHKRQTSDPSSNFSKDRHSDYVLMDGHGGYGLDQIPEDTAETRWAETVKKSQNLYQNSSISPGDKSTSMVNSEQRGDKSSADRDYEEVDQTKKIEIDVNKDNSASINENDPLAKNELSGETSETNSESKKMQLEAVINYMERFTVKRRTSFQSRDSSQSSQPESPSSGEASPQRMNIPMSKIQRPENLRRTRSVSSPKDPHGDYVEMKRPQTEWQQVRSRTSSSGSHDSFKRPLLRGSEANVTDTYAISPFSPHNSEEKSHPGSIHGRYNSDSGIGQHQMASQQKVSTQCLEVYMYTCLLKNWEGAYLQSRCGLQGKKLRYLSGWTEIWLPIAN